MSNSQMMKFALTFSVLSFAICGLTYLLLKRRLGFTPMMNKWLFFTMMSVALLMILGPVYYRVARGNIENPFHQFIQFSQYFLMGWVAINLLTFLSLEVIQAFVNLLTIPFKPEKRIFLTEGVARGIFAGTSALTLAGWAQAKIRPGVKNISIHLKTLPNSFHGFTMAQISDLHVGPLIHQNYVENVVEQTLELKPDVILITGDLVDGSVDQLREQVEPLRKLKAPHGVYFCTGNHEYYSGADEWIAHLESMGIHVFKNSNVILRKKDAGVESKLMLAGVFDWQGARFAPEHASNPFKAAETNEAIDCKILMAHNPFSIEEAAKAGFHLQVSGHTHAGQFYPFAFIVKMALKHSEGLYKINDNTQLYVNRGTGYWGPPNRLGISAEITRFELNSSG